MSVDAPRTLDAAWKRARKPRHTKASAVTVMRPDADGNLRQADVVRVSKPVRWDASGMHVVRKPVEVR